MTAAHVAEPAQVIAGKGQDTALMGGGTVRTCRALETTGLAVCSAVQCQTPSGLWMCGDAHREGVFLVASTRWTSEFWDEWARGIFN